MPCPNAITGCLIPKTYDAGLGDVVDLTLQGGDDFFSAAWGAEVTPDIVVLVYRKQGESVPLVMPQIYADYVDQAISSLTGLDTESAYEVWIRRETVLTFGPWTKTQAYTDAGWTSDSDSEVVQFGIDDVLSGTEIVLIS